MTNELIVFLPLIDCFYGEFGVDWVEWDIKTGKVKRVQNTNIQSLEYIYDDVQNKYVACAEVENAQEEILKNYKSFKINDVYDYYIPWLNLFPDETIPLEMFFFVLNDTDISTEVITFDKNDSYLVIIDEKTNENIRYIPNGFPKEIDIKCIKPAPETEIIARDAKNNIVGKICIRDNRTTYHLNARVVCVVEDSPTKDEEVEQLIEEFRTYEVEDNLNNYSLKQALIKTKIEIDQKYYITLNKTDVEKCLEYLKEDTVASTDKLFKKLLNKYQSRFETDGEKFNGIIIFLNRIDVSNVASRALGSAQIISPEAVIVFKHKYLIQTYAHEIGHTLGLPHTFLVADELAQVEKCKTDLKNHEENIDKATKTIECEQAKINESEKSIKEYQDEIQKLKSTDNQDNVEITKKIEKLEKLIEETKHTNTERQSIIDTNTKAITKHKKKAESNNAVLKASKYIKYAFKEGSTFNIMDYQDAACFFSQWQWQIMQDSIKNNYGTLS